MMRFMLVAAISIGAVGGALLRYWAQRSLNLSALSPAGTLMVNLAGSLLLGFIVGGLGHRADTSWYYGITAGFCGSLTTFSSITLEAFEMIRLMESFRAILYLAFTIGLGMIALIVGYWAGSRLLG